MSRLSRMPRLAGIGIVMGLVMALLCGFAISNNAKASGLEGTTGSINTTGGVITSIVVDNQNLVIDANTKIAGTLVAGAIVEVKYITQADGTLLATEIDVAGSDDCPCNDNCNNNDDCKYSEAEGSLTSVTDTALVINGKTIVIDANTEIEGTLAVGVDVEVEYITQADGTLLATEIDVAGSDDCPCNDNCNNNDDCKYSEAEGSLTSVTDTALVINGKTIVIDANTEIEGTLAVGVDVEVEYITQADGTLLATEIDVEDNSDSELDDDEEDTGDKDEDGTGIKPAQVQHNDQATGQSVQARGNSDSKQGNNRDRDDDKEDEED